MRSGLLEQIEAEVERARGRPARAWIHLKVNSIVDEQTIDALYRASQAGVRVDIWVRGICALRPGVEGLTENISVRSMLGRFLEHSRVFLVRRRRRARVVFIGSADMMHRNLDRRVEALLRITDPQHVAELTSLLEQGMSDDLRRAGSWARTAAGPGTTATPTASRSPTSRPP